MYARTLFRGAKNMQNWKKGCVFGHIAKFWKGLDGKIIRKTHAKAHI